MNKVVFFLQDELFFEALFYIRNIFLFADLIIASSTSANERNGLLIILCATVHYSNLIYDEF